MKFVDDDDDDDDDVSCCVVCCDVEPSRVRVCERSATHRARVHLVAAACRHSQVRPSCIRRRHVH